MPGIVLTGMCLPYFIIPLQVGDNARQEFATTWGSDWESRDAARYLSHYAPSFRSNGRDFASWAARKRKVNAGKKWIKVFISDLSMFRYPGAPDFAVVRFSQDYRSNNLSNVMHKVQYWKKENGSWKIVYEGAG